jgi:hypothetical protein
VIDLRVRRDELEAWVFGPSAAVEGCLGSGQSRWSQKLHLSKIFAEIAR